MRRIRALPSLLLTVSAGLLVARPSAAVNPRWSELSPPSFESSAAVFDSKRNRTSVSTTAGNYWIVSQDPIPQWSESSLGFANLYERQRDRLWFYTIGISGPAGIPGTLSYRDLDPLSPAWIPQSYTGASPRSKNDAAYAYDPVGNRALLFGGYGNLGTDDPRNETYILSLSGTPHWSQVTTLGTPPIPRWGCAGLYDPFRNRMLVFGGIQWPNTQLNETWALSLSTMTWQFLHPRGPVPPARAYASMRLDSLGQRAVMFSRTLTDTWALDLSNATAEDSATWVQLSPGTPLPADPSSVVWTEPNTRRILRQGNELWSLDLAAGTDWTLLQDSLRIPERIGGVAFADRPGSRWVTALGGVDVYARPFDASVPWQHIASGGPNPRYFAGAADDPDGGRSLVFGGCDQSNSEALGQEFADLWAFENATSSWQPLAPASPPPARRDALVLFDPSRHQLVVHGGRYTSGGKLQALADTWAYDAVAGTWSQLPVGGYGQRWRETGIVDPVRDRLVAFGGRDSTVRFSDVHVLSLAGGNWSLLPTGGTPPPPLNFRSIRAAHDQAGDRMLVVVQDSSKMHVYGLTLGGSPTWSRLTVNGAVPRGRTDYALAGVSGGEGILMAGGEFISGWDEGWVLYGQGGTTPALASLVSSRATPGEVRIVWQLSPEILRAVPQRRRDGEGWVALAEVAPDGGGRLSFSDTEVEPGEALEYRLRFTHSGSTTYTEPVAVKVPGVASLRLEGPVGNPISGPLHVRFSLGQDPGARLELLDVAGRRVYSREVGGLGAGNHTLLIEPEAWRRPSGLYFLRLTSHGVSLTSRVTLLE